MKKISLHYLIIIVLGVLLAATIIVSLKAGSKGDKLVLLENEQNTLQDENQDLKDNLVAVSSLTRIEKIASDSGMITPDSFLYVSSNSVAMRGINQVASLP